MSVWQPEPRIPNDDNKKGLRLIGWLLLIWTAITFVVIPKEQVHSSYMPIVRWACGLGGLFFLLLGYLVGRESHTKEQIDTEAHDMMVASHSGNQNDEQPDAENERGVPPGVIGYDPERQRDIRKA